MERIGAICHKKRMAIVTTWEKTKFLGKLKKQMKKNKVLVLIEKDDNGFGAFTANTKSTIIGEGKSVEEAKADLMNSYREVVEVYAEMGKPLPEELKDPEFEYTYDISALFDSFKFLNVSKFAESIGISPSLMRHYKRGDTYISSAQAKRIEDGLHRIARELLQVSL